MSTAKMLLSAYRRRLRRLTTMTTPITAAADATNAQTIAATMTFIRSSSSLSSASAEIRIRYTSKAV